MDDFIINFDTTGTAAGRGPKPKGGRWTDRARDKRLHNVAAARRSKSNNIPSKEHKEENREVLGAGSSAVSLGKRAREEETTLSVELENSQSIHASSSAGVTPSEGRSLITPRRGPKASSSSLAKTGGDKNSSAAKVTIGPSGKKQYISSLFTAEGLPKTSAEKAGPLIHHRPSNAPLRSSNGIDDNGMERQEGIQEKGKRKADPAPALSALGLLPELVEHLANKMGITSPTACQEVSIPALLSLSLESDSSRTHNKVEDRDAILQAQTGSGKTLAFLIPILQDLLTLSPDLFPNPSEMPTRAVGTLALILAPTRELAAQIYEVLSLLLSLPGSASAFSVPPRTLTPCLLVGGANRTHEKSRLRKGCPIIVATPGRLLDHLKTTESFRLAGEPLPKRGPRGKMGSDAKVTGANSGPLGNGRTSSTSDRRLGLRWLVVDECDRLMDLGFEEQMKGVLQELEKRSPSPESSVVHGPRRRRTILCSATASEGVNRLAGIALQNPITLSSTAPTKDEGGLVRNSAERDGLLDTKQPTTSSTGEDNDLISTKDGPKKALNLTPPAQLIHNFVVCPPKLRFVALVALLRRIISPRNKIGADSKGTKILVFLSCTSAVDFYWNALNSLSMGTTSGTAASSERGKIVPNENGSVRERIEREKAEDEAERTRIVSSSLLLPGVPIYRLHGNLDLSIRLGSLRGFSRKSEIQQGKHVGEETENAVLLCTSVAARGLDVPFVSHVVQYDLPTEGGVTEYIHRVGRTARAGEQGQATSFLLPSEKDWVPWVEAGMSAGDGSMKSKAIKLREIGVEEVLKSGYGGEGREFETRATDVQMGFERWVNQDNETAALSRHAFSSHIRAYATHPAAEKAMFSAKALHLGHLAKSFGMREAPSHHAAGGGAKKTRSTGRPLLVKRPGHSMSTVDMADRAIASLPARSRKTTAGVFETGHKHDEERAMLRMKAKMMMGPTGAGGGEFQIASSDMLQSLAKGTGAPKRMAGFA